MKISAMPSGERASRRCVGGTNSPREHQGEHLFPAAKPMKFLVGAGKGTLQDDLAWAANRASRARKRRAHKRARLFVLDCSLASAQQFTPWLSR